MLELLRVGGLASAPSRARNAAETFAPGSHVRSPALRAVGVDETATPDPYDAYLLQLAENEGYGIAHGRPGPEADGWVEVTAGLTAGELVVVEGALMLKSKLKIGELGEHES